MCQFKVKAWWKIKSNSGGWRPHGLSWNTSNLLRIDNEKIQLYVSLVLNTWEEKNNARKICKD